MPENLSKMVEDVEILFFQFILTRSRENLVTWHAERATRLKTTSLATRLLMKKE